MKNKIFLLALLSAVGVVMLTGRIAITGSWEHSGLFWNLFLAWLPLGCTFITRHYWQHRGMNIYGLGVGFLLWLLLFPNAPYLITDLIHLKEVPDSLLWYDALMSFSFALTGLLTGFYSVLIIHRLIEQCTNRSMAWVIMAGCLILCSYGVYLGRFGRWNSWDVLTNPFSLVRYSLSNLHNPVAIKLTITFSLAMLIMYTAFWLYTLKAKSR
ncbi:DUF1361 domain-containing protein [Runella slithyformis]|uniref:DUF1361 domain-containing protein n=1 Tax=Runella slithyformis (strain ATCC 29530 / DSM 19594 / LMG 11500 / NCIMB 11436 / LSU 4) TaxID=761193 RepID=A0A7U3ZI00_RUNSL|nr:DUF1361 domain-containing protein [Runella slithyformis]AEI47541.1 protein of unknown function DUF1361 [Runella slithyformis DSM 19594]